MPRITKVYTRKGDDGSTGLGGGQRVAKESLRVAAYGTVDECNSHIGVALASGIADDLVEPLARIQNDLFHVGSDLCILEEDKQRFSVPKIEPRHVTFLEEVIDRLSTSLDPLENFILPGGTQAAAHLHVARTVCRRAERDVIGLGREEAIGDQVVPYLNRLSDLLFVMARYDNHARGVPDVLWDSYA
ncbi:MAG: cob(I)yrinic acid a,c-diamide adenosyltransferase [Acidobacteriota bacterium]